MPKVIRTVLWLYLFLISVCATCQEELYPEAYEFIQLLVRTDEPTLAEYGKLVGGTDRCGGESELLFLLKTECRPRGWSFYSKSCINLTRQQCEMSEHVPSLELNWLREQFSTAGESYQVLDVIQKEYEYEGYEYYLFEVEIGKNNFLLHYDLPGPLRIQDRIVYVSEVNSKKLSEYPNYLGFYRPNDVR